MSQQRDPYANIPRVINRCNQIDTHELLKQEIYSQTSDGSNRSSGGSAPQPVSKPAAAPQNSNTGFEDYELYFDSTQRDMSSDYSIGEIKWSATTLNNSQDIKNCIEMKIGSFFFPKIYSDPGKPEFFYFRRVFMEFENAPSTQAILGPNNNKFHFEFEVDNLTSQAVLLTPIKDAFFFQRPITSITDFQIRFSVPPTNSGASVFKRVQIPNDTVPIVALTNGGAGYNPARFRIMGSDTSVIGPIGATGTPGVAVFISGLATNDGVVNSNINSTAGVFITNVINATDFEIASIDATAINAASIYGASMFIPKNRIAFPLRFTCTRSQRTNFIEVSHD